MKVLLNRVEHIVSKEEITHYEQFLISPLSIQTMSSEEASTCKFENGKKKSFVSIDEGY